MGPVKLSQALDTYHDLTGIFDIKGNCQLFPGIADWAVVDKDLHWLNSPNCHILTRNDADYPSILKEIHGMPPVLFVRGDIKLLSKPQIAMVGSRNPTPIGCETAQKFAHYFSNIGVTVTSGLAIGIDGAAHKGALSGLGSTVAVLGNGVDRIYPASHEKLALKIAEQGALVSEFPLGTPPIASHFPRRNRIISGLSLGILVVEATLNSGSLITAKLALEQGREVFAITGSIYSPQSKGCNSLIRDGAKLVETAEDVLEELGALLKFITRPDSELQSTTVRLPLEQPYEVLLSEVRYDCTPIDEVVTRSGLTAQKVSSMLLELELKGYVQAIPGGYVRSLV